MRTKSIKGRTAEDIRLAIEQSRDEGFTPALAIAFVSIYQDRSAIRRVFTELGIAVFGVTTNGAFLDESVEKESAAILLFEINPEYFVTGFKEYPEKNYREAASDLARQAQEKIKHPAFTKCLCLAGDSGCVSGR